MKNAGIRLLFFCLFLSLFFPPFAQAVQHPVDILVFSPHPDDETLACGGTILKAIHKNKKVKIVFITNGDAYTAAASSWFKKKPEDLTPDDYIALGRVRQKEAQQAAKKLGLKKEDLIFLNYPDSKLSILWREKVKEGLNKENLLKDIKDILSRYRPKRIYIPHPTDKHSDHKATTLFVYGGLKGLKDENNESWVSYLEIFYYLIHSPSSNIFQEPGQQEDITVFKQRKAEALDEYRSQLSIEKEKDFLKSFIKDSELFWNVPADKAEYLNYLEEEWTRIAQYMRDSGYNINFAPTVDVADNIEDMNHPLGKKQRMYSENPRTVTELASSVIKGMAKGGITAVIKHFPGLGPVYLDTHLMPAKTNISRKELYEKDIFPFKELIKKYPDIWIMIGHAIYPCLSDKPASLSHEIQIELLRKKLGFKGIIIIDELMGMQAIEGYAFQEKIKEPYTGEIAVRAFKAGADIVLIFPPFKKTEDTIFCVVEAVKQALKKERINREEFDDSVERILREKERIFNVPLVHLLKSMSWEEKIMQKIMIDTYENTGMLKKYNLAGVYARNRVGIKNIQKNTKIPLFIAGQNEGGVVSQYEINTRDAYVIGREFERIVLKESERTSHNQRQKNQAIFDEEKKDAFNFDKLDKHEREEIIFSLLNFMDDFIEQWMGVERGDKTFSVHPDYLSPLTRFDGRFEFRPFQDVPVRWLKRFSDPKAALCAYQLLENIFSNWTKGQKTFKSTKGIIFQLKSLKESIRAAGVKEDKSGIRVLCLAAHPDDEDAEALAYFRKKFNCETYVLLATRGEGGENEVDSSLYEELGALRVEEMEKSASILGVKKVYYLGKNDFGYCLNPEEAFRKWNREDTLEKLVYFFRLIRPHMIITKHNKLNTRDHGHHQAMAILAEEAFDLAGDSKNYPEMVKDGLLPWQPFKLYQRAIKTEFFTDMIVVDPQEFIALENKTLHQIGYEALSKHRSQSDWQWLRTKEPDKIYYQLIKSKLFVEKEDSFFDGIKVKPPVLKNLSWDKKEISFSGIPGIKIVKNLKIGLVGKNNRTLFVSLKTLGYDFESLDENFLREGDLFRFDVIILGKDSYISFPAGIQAKERILEFVKKGGNLIIFPQHSGMQSLFSDTFHPLQASFNPISNENAPVTILKPQHPLFNFPNKISAEDFEGWVQERGIYFPFEYSNEYEELTSCFSDRGEQAKGGYLIAEHGKGSYIYTGYSWCRQFREFHFGSLKNLANMLAYSHIKK